MGVAQDANELEDGSDGARAQDKSHDAADTSRSPCESQTPATPMEEWLGLDVRIPEEGRPGGLVKFVNPDGDFLYGWVPPGSSPGQSFRVFYQPRGHHVLQPYSVCVPEGMKPGDTAQFRGLDGRTYFSAIPPGLSPGDSFTAWCRCIKCAPPAPIEALDDEDLRPWLDAARKFEINTDFEVPAFKGAKDADFDSLMNLMKAESVGKATIQLLADKLLLSRFLENLAVPQMPLLFAIENDARLKERLTDFLCERARGDDQSQLFVKPSHMSSAVGILRLPSPSEDAEEQERAIQTLEKHMRQFLNEKANETESLALQSLRPGFVVQPVYESVVGFNNPLELRVITLFGKARVGAWWWGPEWQVGQFAKRNAWIVRCPRIRGELSDDDLWEVIHEHNGSNPGLEAALKLFLRHMPGMAATAEHVASSVGAPFLRVDFFVGNSKWGVRLNEVAYGSTIEHRRAPREKGGRPIDDTPAIAQILREGASLCKTRRPPKEFFARLGIQGLAYEDLRLEPLESSQRPIAPKRALQEQGDPDADAMIVPAAMCCTPRDNLAGSVQPDYIVPPQLPVEHLYPAGLCMQPGAEQPASQLEQPVTSSEVVVTFSNSFMESLEIHWVDVDGEAFLTGNVDPGEAVELTTYTGHNFLLKDSAGTVVKRWKACSSLGSEQTVNCDLKVAVTFVNYLEENVALFWRHPTGQLYPQGQVPAGVGVVVNTFHRHQFQAKTLRGEPISAWSADISLGESQEFAFGAP